MRYWLAAIGFVCFSAAIVALAADPPDRLAARKVSWQKTLDRGPFSFPESTVGVWYSLSQYGGDCKIHFIYDPKERFLLTFKFERDGKEVLTLTGHADSTFCTAKNVLYFAHYPTSTTGCTVAAYDLTTGKKLWATRLNAAGLVSHSAYSNRVTMGLSSDEHGEGVVSIIGQESYGDYVEILDQASGTILAHKVYREGFDSPK